MLVFFCFLLCTAVADPSSGVETIHLVASGDTLVHRRVKKTARTKDKRDEAGNSLNNGGYDWILEDVAPVFRAADISFVNLEAPTDPDMHRKIKGEIFNAPVVLLDALAFAGINVVSFANNHTFDQGPIGLVRTRTELEKRSIMVVGAGEDCAQADALQIKEVRGVRIGFLAMTDLLNINDNSDPTIPCVSLPGPQCTQDCVPDRDAIWYHIEEERLLSRIQNAKSKVDVLIYSFHWGIEYTNKPLPLYKKLAPKMIEAGVDVLLGHHPHTLQPVVRHTRENGSEGVIAYSLGNLFSDMSRRYGRYPTNTTRGKTRDGILLSLKINVQKNMKNSNRITMQELQLIPIWTENSRDDQSPDIRVRRHQSILNEDPHRKKFIEQRRKAMSFLSLPPLE
jgi:hypothetical protein